MCCRDLIDRITCSYVKKDQSSPKVLQFSGFTVTTQINIIPRHLSPDKLREERPSKDTKTPHAFKA